MPAVAGKSMLTLLMADEPSPDKPAADSPAAKEPADDAKTTEQPRPVEVPRPKTLPRKPLPSEAAAQTPAAEKPTLPARSDPFAGGVRTQLTFKLPVNCQTVEQYLGSALEKTGLSLESVAYDISNEKYREGEDLKYSQWTLKIMLPPERVDALLASMKDYLADNPIFPSSNRIGKTVAGNTQLLAIYALTASWLGIIIYLWIRFQGVAFGLAAVVALIHDIFIMLGAVAASIYVAPYLGFLMIEPLKINLTTVAAFLTIIGYSVNDTIVIFDRIREIRGKDPNLTGEMVNLSTNQCMSRTMLTSFTVLLVILVLYIFGGEAIHGFAFALLVGVLTGVYSTVYVASPILLWLVGKRGPGKRTVQRTPADLRQTKLPSRRS